MFKATLCSSDDFVKQHPLEPLWCTCTVVNNRNSPVTAVYWTTDDGNMADDGYWWWL